jgi:tetratricopeptide (TPR) repeat protein
MTDRTELDADLAKRIDSILTKSGEFLREGNMHESERLSLEAWDLLPEPKLSWEFYSNIIPRDNMLFYRDTKQFDKALQWLEITRTSYSSTPEHPNQVVEFQAATIYFEMGRLDDAYTIFDRQYKTWKRLPFKGKDNKYIDFYLAEKAKRK